MENDVVKKGFMYVKRPPSQSKIRLKTWQKRYMVLRDNSEEKSARLELYENAGDFCQSSANVHTLDLAHVVHIGPYSDSKRFPTALVITPDGRSPVIMASEIDGSVREWLVAIRCLAEKEQNRPISATENKRPISEPRDVLTTRRSCSPFTTPNTTRRSRGSRGSLEPPSIFQELLYGKVTNNNFKGQVTFPVHVQKTCNSLQQGLSGDYVLCVRPDAIVLQDGRTGADTFQWPLANVRKFKSEPTGSSAHLVTLEAGLLSKVGEGTYVFRTLYGPEIVRSVRDAVQGIRRRRMSHCHDKQQMAAFSARGGTLMGTQHSASSPNIDSVIETRTIPSPLASPGDVSPPPVPPRSVNSGSSTGSAAGMSYLDMPGEEEAVFSPDGEDGRVEYAALRHSSNSSDDDTPGCKHDDSGFSESSDDAGCPIKPQRPTVVQRHVSTSPPATLPRATRRHRSYRPPPPPPVLPAEDGPNGDRDRLPLPPPTAVQTEDGPKDEEERSPPPPPRAVPAENGPREEGERLPPPPPRAVAAENGPREEGERLPPPPPPVVLAGNDLQEQEKLPPPLPHAVPVGRPQEIAGRLPPPPLPLLPAVPPEDEPQEREEMLPPSPACTHRDIPSEESGRTSEPLSYVCCRQVETKAASSTTGASRLSPAVAVRATSVGCVGEMKTESIFERQHLAVTSATMQEVLVKTSVTGLEVVASQTSVKLGDMVEASRASLGGRITPGAPRLRPPSPAETSEAPHEGIQTRGDMLLTDSNMAPDEEEKPALPPRKPSTLPSRSY